MAASSEVYFSQNLEVARIVLSPGELAAVDVIPQPRYIVDAGNLNPGQLAILTNVSVIPILNGEVEGRSGYGNRPADIQVNGEYISLSSDSEADTKAASLISADQKGAAQAAGRLPAPLFELAGSVASVHRRSLDHVSMPAVDTASASGLMHEIGESGARLMEHLAVWGLLDEMVDPDGRISRLEGPVYAPGGDTENADVSSIFGFGRNVNVGAIPGPLGIVALQLIANRRLDRGEAIMIADADLMSLMQPDELERLSGALADMLGATVMSKVTLIDVSGIDKLLGTNREATSQYDLILSHPRRSGRKVAIPADQYDTPMAAPISRS